MTSQIVRMEPKPGAPAGCKYENSRQWIITAPWAHPWWSQYIAFVYPLYSGMHRFKPGMTHEFMLYALDPKHPPVIDETNTLKSFAPLSPQTWAISSRRRPMTRRSLESRIINCIDGMTLSPTPTFARSRGTRFSSRTGTLSCARSSPRRNPNTRS